MVLGAAKVQRIGHCGDTDGNSERARRTEELIVFRAWIEVRRGDGLGGHGGGRE